LQFLVLLLEAPIDPPSHPLRLRREGLTVECAAILAAEQNKTQQALLAEGLNAVFLEYGKPAIAS
jgi:hypothetical protein